MDTAELSHALHAVEVDPAADLLTRVRIGGERRQRRRRRAVAGSGAVVALALLPAFALLGSGAAPRTTLRVAGPPPPAWQARWPLVAADLDCGRGGRGASALPRQYPDLLLLPSGAVDGTLVNANLSVCPRPHTALLLQRRGSAGPVGLVVSGPNARTPEQTGQFRAPDGFSGREGHEPIQGRPAFSATYDVQGEQGGDFYWTTADGGQWQATATGLGWRQALGALDGLTMDADGGTATLDAPTVASWSVLPAPAALPDPGPGPGTEGTHYAARSGEFEARWTDAGKAVSLSVDQGRVDDRTLLRLACCATTDVGGHPAAYLDAPAGGALVWSPAPGDYAALTVAKGSPDDALRIARSLTLADPADPRLSMGPVDDVTATPGPDGG